MLHKSVFEKMKLAFLHFCVLIVCIFYMNNIYLQLTNI